MHSEGVATAFLTLKRTLVRDRMACGAVLGGKVQKQGCLEHLGILGRSLTEHKAVHSIASCDFFQRRRECKVQNALNSSERQLRSLDAYFDKLHDVSKRFSILNERAKLQDKSKELAAEKALRTLEGYKDKISKCKIHEMSFSIYP